MLEEGLVGPGGGNAEARVEEDETQAMECGERGQRLEALASAFGQGGAGLEEERDVGAEAGGEVGEAIGSDGVTPEGVQG